ncbi:MAG: ATP-dependent DNA ligase [Longimicrobiales bacterium]
MNLPIEPPFPPMEALSVDRLPDGEDWQYEPKWDGFRCLAFRDGTDVYLQSKAEKPLARYFPDIAAVLGGLAARKFVLDGELVIPVDGILSFDALQLRLHPAESRVRMLAERHPARFVVFDLLVDGGRSLLDRPLMRRRAALEAFAGKYRVPNLILSPATSQLDVAAEWLRSAPAGLDGVVAKRLDEPYQSGVRSMRKIKRLRTADCVVGGFRYAARGRALGSLLLGLFDDDGLLHHVGFTSSFASSQRRELLQRVEPLRGGPGFTGRAPGGPSRWTGGKESPYEPLRHELVVEVSYDHFSGGRFRHGTQLLRWRSDKDPRQCTMQQLARPGGPPPGLF